jgi:DOMON domain
MKSMRLLQLCLAVGFVKVSNGLADPSAYFGGTNHDVYVDWITNDLMVGRSNSRYPHSFFLSSAADASLGVAVHYRLDAEKNFLHLALAARAHGWLSFGLSENGGMSGSDLLIYEAANSDVVIDAYVLEERQPIVDDCASNWILQSSKQEAFDDGFIMIEVSRALDTGDLQDHRVFNDTEFVIAPHRVIAAWGDEPTYGYHGLVNRARSSIRWFGDSPSVQKSFSNRMAKDADAWFELRSNNHAVKPKTEYAEFFFDYDDLNGMGVPSDIDSMSMIAFEAIIDPRAANHVQ